MYEKIKEYKEFAAILVFIIGGFLWIESRYAYKVELAKNSTKLSEIIEKMAHASELDKVSLEMATKIEINTLRCLMKSYMSITGLHSEIRNKQSKIIEAENILKDVESSKDVIETSPAIERVVNDKLNSLRTMEEELDMAILSLTNEETETRQGKCGAL